MNLLTVAVVLVTSFLCASISFAACEDHGGRDSESANQKNIQSYTQLIRLTGMSCDNCVKNVNKELNKLKLDEGLKLKVDINTITIDYSQNKDISAEALKRVLNDIKAVLTKTSYKIVES